MIHRTVWIAGLVSLFTDISSEMIVPVLPLFLATGLQAPVAAIGVIEGITESLASLLKGVSGWLSDRAGRRKPLMTIGYGLSNVVKPLLGLSSGWLQVLVLRTTDRVGKGLRGAPRDALIADVTPVELRGRAYGMHRAMDTVGAAIGPFAAFLILQATNNDYRQAMLWSAVPGLLAVAVLLFFLRETPAVRPPVRAERPAASGAQGILRGWSLNLSTLDRRLRGFILISTVFALGNSSDAFLILRSQSLGMAPMLIPLAYFTFNLVYSLVSYPAGMLSDRIGRRPVLVAGYGVFALIYAGFALAGDAAWGGAAAVWFLFAGYGLYYAATEGVQKAYLADLAAPEQRGTAIGVFNALTGLAALPASVLAGLLWDRVSPAAPFWAGAALAVAAAAALALHRPKPG